MKTLLLSTILILTVFNLNAQQSTFYSLKAKTIDGQDFDFSSLMGKKVLIVNTASKCGFTPQYKDLEDLYKSYGGENFVILGFPANNFAKQEPGSNKEILEFCTANYGVSFQLMSKISVKGEDIHPVYQWLTQKSLNGVLDSEVSWNFQKYLVDAKGELIRMVSTREKPTSDLITTWITGK